MRGRTTARGRISKGRAQGWEGEGEGEGASCGARGPRLDLADALLRVAEAGGHIRREALAAACERTTRRHGVDAESCRRRPSAARPSRTGQKRAVHNTYLCCLWMRATKE
eukprot:6193789-Pleurochrysis_carterae.AAC.2